MNGQHPALPYPGLRAFTRDESLLFFGRESCVDSMIERLASARFLAVLGASGSGKSSLVRTGLFDALELGFFARAGTRWRIVETHPGGAPMQNLASALALASKDGDKPSDIEELLRQGRRSVIEWASGTRLAPGENLLILVDQFEELFRYSDFAAREEAEDFVALLIESARAADLPIHIVITMRSEYIGACALITGLAEQINSSFYLTPRMSREECRQAIEGPAAVMGFEIEPALTNRILNDMASFAPWEEERGVAQGQILSRRADQLPLMQHLLNRLWLRARDEAGGEGAIVLTVSGYLALGGLVGALDAHGKAVLASLEAADRTHAETVFRALISGPDPTNAVRRPCRLGVIDERIGSIRPSARGAAARIVDAFRAPDCNFLQPGMPEELTSDTLIDISHESLIRQWSTLSQWLQNEARAGANWRRLLLAADRYAAGESDLLTGLELATLQQWWEVENPSKVWADRHGGRYEDAESFLRSSIAAQELILKRRFRERWFIYTSFAFGLCILAISLTTLYLTKNENEIQRVKSQKEIQMEKLKSDQQNQQKNQQIEHDQAILNQINIEKQGLIKDKEYQDAFLRASSPRYKTLIDYCTLNKDDHVCQYIVPEPDPDPSTSAR